VIRRKDPDLRTVSNIIITNECYKKMKMMSVDKEISIQDVISEILERVVSKQFNNIKSLEEMVKTG